MWQVELVDMVKREDRVGSIGLQVKQVAGQKQVILSGLKMGSNQSGCRSGRVGSSHIFRMNFFLYKENNMFLSFGKSYNKLLDIKCITLNSLLKSRMNLVKLINTYSIILKLYKS